MTQNVEKWGRATAKARYGGGATFSPPADQSKPQMPEDKHGPRYDNDASGWVRGAGETAENKPGFDRTKLKRS